MKMDEKYINDVLPGLVALGISKQIADARSLSHGDVNAWRLEGPVKNALKKDPKFISVLGEELNRILKTAAMLDKVADSLESRGFMKEAEEIDFIANTIEAGPFGLALEGDRGKGELRQMLMERVKSKPGY